MKSNFFTKKYYLFGLVLLILSSFLFTNYASASSLGVSVAQVLGHVIEAIVYALGFILTALMGILIAICGYNDFITSPAVTNGWVIVRDLCNMFFILILLIIAFATILRIESYNYKKLLPKLLIMAVLINFSKTICGLLIDFGQVIMLTFVNGFKEMGSANLTTMLGLDKIMSVNPDTTTDVSGLSVFGSYMLALIYVLISLVVVTVIIAVLVMRMVMLWVYIVLSPLAYLAAAFPAGQKYSSQWWSEFSKNVVVGPMLAFFIWLSFISATSGLALSISPNVPSAGITQAGSSDNILKFIISIGMLIGGLMVTQQMGGAIGSIAGKGMAALQKGQGLAIKGALGTGSWAARKFALFQGFEYGKADEVTGEKKRLLRGFEIRPTKIYEGVKKALTEKKEREESEVQAKAGAELREGRLLGGLGASQDFTEAAARGFMWNRAWRPDKKGAVWSTIRSKDERRELMRLEKEKKRAEEDYNNHPDDEAKFNIVKDLEDQVEKQKKRAEEIKAPYTFYADSKRREIIAAQAKKLGDNDNEHDLVEKFLDAERQGNKELAAAIFIHAARVGHSNEMLEMVHARKEVKNDKGEVVTNVGGTFRADNSGLKAMVRQYFIEGLKMSEQEAFALQNDFSVQAKKVNHYNLSESVGVKSGLLVQQDDSTQQRRAHGEMMKRDVEQLLRQLNRLGHGGEIQYEYGGETRRIADYNEQSELTFYKTAPSFDQEVNKRQRLNNNFAMNLYNTYKTEQEINGIAGMGAKPDLKAAIGPFRSIMTALKESGNADHTFIDADGKTKTYKQLALETLIFGKSKYEATKLADLKGKQAAAKTKKEKDNIEEEIRKENAISEAINKQIMDELRIISPNHKLFASGGGGSPKPEGGSSGPSSNPNA
jgi:hypothetical protein